MDKSEEASKTFRETFNCAQAVLSAFGPELGLERKTALKVAAAFGGGLARMGETCGAVTGALMAIGLKHGKTMPEDKVAQEATQRMSEMFLERFKSMNYSVLCRELLGCEVGTEEGMKFLKENNLRERLCTGFIADAALILEELLSSGQ
jgi:C_GCAxxG_C_C family probable redox protein